MAGSVAALTKSCHDISSATMAATVIPPAISSSLIYLHFLLIHLMFAPIVEFHAAVQFKAISSAQLVVIVVVVIVVVVIVVVVIVVAFV